MAIKDFSMWAEGLPDTDEVMQGILDEIARRCAFDNDKVEITDDEGELDLPQPYLNGSTKWHSQDEFVLDVSEHYFVEIGEMYHEGRNYDKVLSALFRDKRNPGPGVVPCKRAERNVEGLRELLRWVRANAQNLRTKGACKNCQRLAVIGADFFAKHCRLAVTKG